MSRTPFAEEPTPGRRIWLWALPFVTVLLIVVGQLLAIVPVIESGLIHEDDIERYPQILYMLFVAFGAATLLNVLWVRFVEKRTLAGMGLVRQRRAPRWYARGFAWGLLMPLVIIGGVVALGGYEVEGRGSFADLLPLLLLMAGFIVQSGSEEILFRGWLMSRLIERHGVWFGILGNSTMFTLLHLPGVDFATTTIASLLIFVAMTYLFSILLSLMALSEGSVWGACAWHAAWNWSFIGAYGLPTTGIAIDLRPLLVDLRIAEGAPDWLTGGTDGPETTIVTVVVLGLACVLAAKGRIFRSS